MPKSKDFKPNTDKCFRCGKTFVPSPHGGDEAVLCRACASIQRRTTIDKKGKPHIHNFSSTRVHSHPKDADLLNHLSRGTIHPEFLYTQAWKKRHGKCSRCRKHFGIMRIVPTSHKVFIKSLLCPSCYAAGKPAGKPARKPLPATRGGLAALMWAKADAFTRAMLANNPTFLEMAKQAALPLVDKPNP